MRAGCWCMLGVEEQGWRCQVRSICSLVFRHFSVAVLLLVVVGSAVAQSDRGAIVGTVLDSSGATIANATVTATGADTGAVYKTTTTSTGAYRIPDMQVGTYNV